MSTPENPTYGPCTNWISAEDVAAVCTALDSSGDPAVYDVYARQASEILWAASGRQYSGSCGPVTARPCVKSCGCWPLGLGYYGFSWDSGGWWVSGGGDGFSAVQGWVGAGGGCYSNGCCGFLSRVKLAGYPVTEIVEVLIDGNTVDPANYRLDSYKWLTYLDDPDTGQVRRWPACQNLALDDDQPGTFSVTYVHGIAPPQIGLDAAVQLACALATATEDCELPPGTQQVERQGIRIALNYPASSRRGGLPPGFSDLALVKLFLDTVNPYGLTRRSAVFTPDQQQYAQKLG